MTCKYTEMHKLENVQIFLYYLYFIQPYLLSLEVIFNRIILLKKQFVVKSFSIVQSILQAFETFWLFNFKLKVIDRWNKNCICRTGLIFIDWQTDGAFHDKWRPWSAFMDPGLHCPLFSMYISNKIPLINKWNCLKRLMGKSILDI